MDLKIKLAAVALALGLSAAAQAAPSVWSVNGHSYEFIAGDFNWDEARADALSKGGYLATVTSAGENSFLVSVSTNLAWLGGSDAATEGAWKWADGPESGQAFSYTNWSSGEPNDCCNGEDYLQISWAGNTGFWNDHGGPGNAYQRNGYFLEMSTAPVPEPSSAVMLLAGLAVAGAARRRSRRS